MRGGGDLHSFAREIATDAQAAVAHAGEVFLHKCRAEMGGVDQHRAVFRSSPRRDFRKRGARDPVAGRTFQSFRIVALHVTFAPAVEQMGPGAAQALLEQSAVKPRAGDDEARGMKLDHFHIHQMRARAIRHRDSIRRFFLRAGGPLVHERACAGGENHRLAFCGDELPGLNIEQHGAQHAPAIGGREQFQAARVLQTGNSAGKNVVAQSRHDLDAGQVADVDGAVERLPRKGFLVDAAIRRPIEHAADLVLQLPDNAGRILHQRPRQVLIIQESTAAHRVLEVRLHRIHFIERDVVPTLHHAGATALAEHPFRNEENFLLRVAPMRMQRRHQARAARAQNQDIGGDLVGHNDSIEPRRDAK